MFEAMPLLSHLLTYLLTYLLNYSKEQSSSCEANWFSASHEIPCILWSPKFITAFTIARHLSLSRAWSIQHMPPLYFLKIHLNIILPSRRGSPQVVSFPQVSPPKPRIRLCPPPYALHSPSISFFSILSPKQYCVKRTDHSAPHYTASFTHLLPRPS